MMLYLGIKSAYFVPVAAWGALYILTNLISTQQPMKYLLFFSLFYRRGNQGTEKLNNLYKVAQLIRDNIKWNLTQAV